MVKNILFLMFPGMGILKKDWDIIDAELINSKSKKFKTKKIISLKN